MGFDRGFDISPRLESNPENKALYANFIKETIDTYGNDFDDHSRRKDKDLLQLVRDPETFEHDKNFIRCTVGEYPGNPTSPDHCEYFLRFTSKVSGSISRPSEKYNIEVCKIAKKWFREDRMKPWHELAEDYGSYDWQELSDATAKVSEFGKVEKLEDEAKETGDKEEKGADGGLVKSEASS